jgi:hypothetical protein
LPSPPLDIKQGPAARRSRLERLELVRLWSTV